MAAAAAALRLLRRRPPMLRSLLAPGTPPLHPQVSAVAALPAVCRRAHVVAPPMMQQPSLLRYYSGKGTDATAAVDISMLRQGEQRSNPVPNTEVGDLLKMIMEYLENTVNHGLEQVRLAKEAAGTCERATIMLGGGDLDKAFAMWEEGSDELERSVALLKSRLDGIAKLNVIIKESPLGVMDPSNREFSEAMRKFIESTEDVVRDTRLIVAEVEEFHSTSSMTKLYRSRRELETMRRSNTEFVQTFPGGAIFTVWLISITL
ncbi:uncharacterized protein LOC104582326 isoform X2 [Brachypodium distachyon]|uniref:uncharacterized protein LOC104582326 isoform X2 n=1 Tax=Brachypodium distachyon TaxID=15368 RepID=UPI00071D7C88|nr:uncharacterized protein LOC104582326 isoform X2 [Brachypodium distachyon]|eukprot:XP_014752101.1 uncharacterized protein LOC104582326 isoform X2 [Brachypodium distachyon]